MGEWQTSSNPGKLGESPPLKRAAEYVRMSTDHQKYSTENQSAAIRDYAVQNGIEIVRTYTDHGKSGLNIQGRDALQQLINDVENGLTDFDVILVYDVSRWGRFQDADESAYYEYICRRAGKEVQYCAEQFTNDGSPVATIVKGVKRAMAGEYSRELSVKVFSGQCRLIEHGFRQGGPAGFGLRRMRVNQHGEQLGILDAGEQKNLQTDRVILVPGPEEEVETVRWMYRTFVEDGKAEQEIADILNDRGILSDFNRPWTRGTVHQILINPKYIGDNVWNRVSFKLKKKRIRNRSDTWIRARGAFKGIVERNLFETVQTIIANRSRRLTDQEMLSGLKELYKTHGQLSGLIIDETENLPSSSSYGHRFGSLLRAYQLIGYTPRRDYRYIEINRNLRRLHPEIIEEIITGLNIVGASVFREEDTDLLVVNNEFSLAIIIARCRETPAGALRWRLRFDTGHNADITVAVRMDTLNKQPLDFYLFPRIDRAADKIRLTEENELSFDAYRVETLDFLYELAVPVRIREAA